MKRTIILGIVGYDGSHTNSNAGTCRKITKIDKNLIIQITPAEFTSVYFSSEKYIVLKIIVY